MNIPCVCVCVCVCVYVYKHGFPSDISSWLKYAVVKTLHKNGNKHELSNYRPISLLTAFSKIFEKVIYNRLHKHLEIHNILANEQSGFRPDHSTEQAAFTLINCILNAMNNN